MGLTGLSGLSGLSGIAGGATASLPWYRAGGAPAPVAAYAPKGAASLAASYSNLVTPGTYDASAGTAPTWNAATGWIFAAASTQYLLSNIAGYAVTWTVLVRFSGVSGDYRTLLGIYDNTGASAFAVQSHAGTDVMACYNGLHFPAGYTTNATAMSAGVYGFAGKTPYRDGAAESSVIPAGAMGATETFYIGALNQVGSGATQPLEGNIQALVVYASQLTAPQVLAVSTAMAAL